MASNRAKYHKWSSLFQLLLKENVNSKFYEEKILWKILEISWKRGHENAFRKTFAIVNCPELRRVLTTFNLKDNFLNKYSGGHTSSVIRQKDEPQNGCLKERKHAKFPQKEYFLPPDTHTFMLVSGGMKRSLRKIWRALFSWNTRVEICPFALLPTTCHCDGFIFTVWQRANDLVLLFNLTPF